MENDELIADALSFEIPPDIPMQDVITEQRATIDQLSYELTVRNIRIKQLTNMLIERGGRLPS